MGRSQHEINAEIELHRPEREALVRRIEHTFAVCEDVSKRMMETTSAMPCPESLKPQRHPGSGMNWFSPVACEPCACGTPNHSACSVTEFNRRAFATAMNLVREPKGCPIPGACSCIEPDPSLKAAWEAVRVRDADINATVKKREATIATLRTSIRSARRIVQHFASANPKHIWDGHEQDPLGAHAWLESERAEIGTARDGGDPKVEKAAT